MGPTRTNRTPLHRRRLPFPTCQIIGLPVDQLKDASGAATAARLAPVLDPTDRSPTDMAAITKQETPVRHGQTPAPEPATPV